jgi:SAM-dependent methyltransferase
MIGIAQLKLGPNMPDNVTFRQERAEAPIESAPFDAICAFSLLHLVDDVPAVLRHVHDQLKPGGLFIAKTVCLKDGNVLIRALVSVLHAVGYAPKVTFLSTEEHVAQLRAAGFEIEQVERLGSGRMEPFIVARRVEA